MNFIQENLDTSAESSILDMIDDVKNKIKKNKKPVELNVNLSYENFEYNNFEDKSNDEDQDITSINSKY